MNPDNIEQINTYNTNSFDNPINSSVLLSNKKYDELTTDEIKLNLKTLSMVKEYDKLCINNNLIEIDNTTSLKRTLNSIIWKGYTRKDVINFILHLTDESLKLSDKLSDKLLSNDISDKKNKKSNDKYFDENTLDLLRHLSNEMTLALNGLRNIKMTYYKDSSIQSRLNLVIEKMEKRVRKINDIKL